MRHFLLYFFALLQINLFSQTGSGTTPAADDVIKLDPRASQFDFVPGQILIKLKDDVSVSLAKVNGVTVMGVASIDAVLQKHNMQKAEKLFPKEKRSFNKRMLKTSNGKEFEQPNLHNIYKIEGDSTLNIFEVINELKELPTVEYAEPNYILSVVDSKPVSPALNEGEMIEWLKEHPEINVANSPVLPMTNDLLTNDKIQKPNVVTPNDPLYLQQWGIPATQVDAVWDSTTGDTTQLIAILDTGVDWLHPDLKNKIWTNPNEIPDNGIDDDGNGYVDDVRGWDWINNDNNPTDDNSHGTHVAGIAAAESNNGIGIAGVNWKAKILPLKVFQSSGRGDAATISRSIIYATQKGATVINMSFGSYARSLAMEDALANAYVTCVLVAAAGNDNLNLNDDIPIIHPTISYPAGLFYVLGVHATQSSLNLYSTNLFKKNTYLTDFTNYDDSGPIFSKFLELQNYELQAPGVSILSTIPNGNYRIFDGTSMATPIVSGAVALYKSINKNESDEILWAKFIRASSMNINLYNTINSSLSPQLALISSYIVDTLSNDDKDGRVDAGETIQLWYKIRNTGSQADSTFVGVKFGEFEDTTTAQILIPNIFLGSISTYATKTNELTPFKIHINSSVVNSRNITFQAFIGDKNSQDTVFQNINIAVENGQQLEGVMDSTFVLTPDRLWIVNGSFRVGANGTMIIKPGTHLVIGNQVTVRGSLIAIGTKDSLILITSATPSKWNSTPVFNFESSNVVFKYVNFYNLMSPLGQNGAISATNCIFDETQYTIGNNISIFNDNLVKNSQIYYFWNFSPSLCKSNVFYNNYVVDRTWMPSVCMYNTYYKNINTYYSALFPSALITSAVCDTSKFFNNSFINSTGYCNSFLTSGSTEQMNLGKQYWGSTVPKTIRKQIFDFYKNSSLPLAVFEPTMLTIPPDSCHGLVWKVLVDGIDPQDQAYLMNPIGVGTHRFDVYFNRPMDTTYKPQLTFGVRDPFNQQAVADSGHWSDNARIWTAYKTVKLYTGDGINTIRVANARDLEDFEIPVEDMRFEFLISAAGSSSLDFAATAGLGKVNLEWSNPQDVPDLLGYNMYRLEHINDTTLTQPVMINTSLINDTLFTDYKVIPNKKYYYYYRTVRTDFSESDSSRVVSTTPYTAALGDGNGDLSVNVLDVLGTVSYILGQNPQPFIFDAADVVRDSIINVLDVVGNVNIILKGTLLKNYLAKTSYGNAKVEFTGNEVYLTTDQPVAGIQLQFKGKGLKDKKFIYSGSAAFENMSSSIGDTTQIALMYSLNKNKFAPGKYLIGTIEGDAKDISLSEAVLADNEGGKINLNLVDNGVSTIPDNYYLDQNYPNPFNLSTTIQYGVPAKTAGKIVIYNILGQQVRTFDLGEREAGRYKLIWDGKNNYGNILSSGVYIFRFESVKFISAKKMMLLK